MGRSTSGRRRAPATAPAPIPPGTGRRGCAGCSGAGRADEVLAALRRAGGDECDKAAGYIAERRDRMRYDEYLARGLPIGSGRVEAACKTVVGRRLKCTGMRWTVAGANPVLWVRCARLSGWFDEYWDERLRRAA